MDALKEKLEAFQVIGYTDEGVEEDAKENEEEEEEEEDAVKDDALWARTMKNTD